LRWRSPSSASEDRNYNGTPANGNLVLWRSPSSASEDRNSEGDEVTSALFDGGAPTCYA
jgi:hypothetical protein